jgi:GntP family gluconate:H+ symporter
MSFLPILMPIALMLLKTVGAMCGWKGFFINAVNVLGTPAVALFVGLAISMVGYHQMFPEDKKAWGFDGVIADSLRTAGQIILIVGAGGAFSGVLKASNLQDILTVSFSGLTIGILAPFLIGFIFRTCVGSATIAMVTAATMITPLIDVLGFSSPMGRIIAMLACAAGGMMIFHGNDDFFWVTATTSEMDTSVAYKTLPIISVMQSLTALATVFILSLIFLH